ncbi:Ferrichrome receptor FcuA precursor [Pigmentiphaga humi]|uniref:Ferrichrome receptor FcuA n=2 Tax=Pigmentiphaga humi TaxID=2478468 RepID=A0A3P4AZJ2_9BURK|nr:Ferrichrome receptor FcuA precursor [Pigmentiphaga humi]
MAPAGGNVNGVSSQAAAGGATTLPAVTVTGTAETPRGGLPPAFAGGQVARGGGLGLLGNRDIMDAPFSLTSYTAQSIEDQQARSISDAVKNDASVRTIWADGSYSSQMTIRGFPVQAQDMAINGVYGIVPPQLTGGLEMVERVEILRGPGALLYGMAPSGAVGGTVNLVAKRATDAPITRLTTSYWSDAQFGAAIDLGRRLGEDKQFGIRFNAAYRDGDTALDKQQQRVGFASLGLDYRSDRVRISADLGYHDMRSDNPTRPIYTDNASFQIPKAPPGDLNLGQSWYYAKSEDTYGMVRGEVDLADDLTAYAVAGGRRNDFLGLYNFIYLQNGAGDFRANQYYQPTYADTKTFLGGVTGRLNTGPLRHTIDLSVSVLGTESGVLAPVIATYNGNLYDPVSVSQPSLSGFSSDAPKTSFSRLASVALADTISAWDDRVQFTAGLRRQSVKVDNYNAATGLRTATYDEDAYTPAFALLVKPWQHVSLYANYIQGLGQGPAAPASAANSGTVFAPIKSKQYEVGAKARFDGVGASIAYFEIKQPSGFLDPASNTFGMDGEQRNRGLEINAHGEVARGVRLLGGVSFIDGKLTKTAGGANDGNKAVGVPGTLLNLAVEWDLPSVPGLTLSARHLYTSSQYYNPANTQKIPGWHRTDIGVRYRARMMDKGVTLRAGIANLFDKDYWAGASANYGLARGYPRTYMVSATIDF